MTEENKITEEEQMQITMGLIINAGNAKAFAVEAITCAKNGDFEGAKAKLKMPIRPLSKHTIPKLGC